MQRKRGEFVPAKEALSDLGGPVKAIRKASPQALHHLYQYRRSRVGKSAIMADLNRLHFAIAIDAPEARICP